MSDMNDRTDPPQRVFSNDSDTLHASYSATDNGQAQHSQGMRRRTVVFFSVFLISLLLSLAYTFLRSPTYMANARLQITPATQGPAETTATATAPGPSGPQAFLVEVQILTSRPLLEKAVRMLQERGHGQALDADPVGHIERMLTVTLLEGSQMVQLQAQGAEQGLVAPVIEAVIEAYRDQQVTAATTAAQTGLTQAREELAIVTTQLTRKQQALEAFGRRSSIVSSERDENLTLTRLKGLGASLSSATDREATAAGRLRAIEQAVADGRRAPQARDNPTVAGIETRLSQMREEWRALERQFTPTYLDMDALARSLRTRINNLEEQLLVERGKSQQAALADAREELASTRAASQRLRQQLADDQLGVQTVSRQLSQYQGLREELQGVEKMRQSAAQKLLALESGESARRARMRVVEPPAPPTSPWRPLYWRDAGISLTASLLLSFLAVWFVEFFNRLAPASPGASTVILAPPWAAQAPARRTPLVGMAGPETLTQERDPRLLGLSVARELRPDEVQSLLETAAPENRAMLACLLCGLTADEVVSLRLQHIDTASGTLTVPGDASRTLPLPKHLPALAAQRASPTPDASLFTNATARPLDLQDVNAVVTSSAYDAGLSQPESVTPATLRHTYVAFLVRQGLRFSELGHLAGRLSAEYFKGLAPLVPPAQRVSIDSVERLLPVLRSGGP